MIYTCGRLFACVAEFPDTDEGTAQANAYMEATPGVGVLLVEDGKIRLAHCDDKGVPMEQIADAISGKVVVELLHAHKEPTRSQYQDAFRAEALARGISGPAVGYVVGYCMARAGFGG